MNLTKLFHFATSQTRFYIHRKIFDQANGKACNHGSLVKFYSSMWAIFFDFLKLSIML